MSRLPTPGQDDNQWGTILNDYLSQEHNPDGSQKPLPQSKVTNLTTDLSAINDSLDDKADSSDLTGKEDKTNKGSANGYAPLGSDSKVPTANLPASTTPSDASTTTKGLIQLSGDLSGTASSPTVPALTSLDTRLDAVESRSELLARGYLFYDRFDRAVGLFTDHPVALTGQTWTIEAATPLPNPDLLMGADGVLRYNYAGSNRDYVNLASEPEVTSIEFTLDSTNGAPGALGLLISRHPSTSPFTLAINSVHLTLSVSSVGLSFYEGSATSPASIVFSHDVLVTDGVARNRLTMSRIGPDTVTIALNGKRVGDGIDARIARLWGTKLVMQHFQSGLAPNSVGITEVYAR